MAQQRCLMFGHSNFRDLSGYVNRGEGRRNFGMNGDLAKVIGYGGINSAHLVNHKLKWDRSMRKYIDVTALLERAIHDFRPSVICIMTADNDVETGKTAEEIAMGHIAICRQIQRKHRIPKLVVCQLLPRYNNRHGSAQEEVASYNVTVNSILAQEIEGYSNMYFFQHGDLVLPGECYTSYENSRSWYQPDGIHFTEKGLRKFYRTIRHVVIRGW